MARKEEEEGMRQERGNRDNNRDGWTLDRVGGSTGSSDRKQDGKGEEGSQEWVDRRRGCEWKRKEWKKEMERRGDE
jgi:hypothetical protein